MVEHQDVPLGAQKSDSTCSPSYSKEQGREHKSTQIKHSKQVQEMSAHASCHLILATCLRLAARESGQELSGRMQMSTPHNYISTAKG